MPLQFPTRRSVLKMTGAGILSAAFSATARAEPVPAQVKTSSVWHEIPPEIESVDTKLVLLADVSGSMTESGGIDEIALQRDGTIYALTHPRVIAAVEAKAKNGGVALTFGCFSGSAEQTVPMVIVRTRADLEAYAVRIRMGGIRGSGVGTHIGLAVRQAAQWTMDSPCDAFRKIVDVSGDGPDNQNLVRRMGFHALERPEDPMTDAFPRRTVIDAVAHAAQLGITVNGLPICTTPGIHNYYNECVATPEGVYSHKLILRGREYFEETPAGFVIPAESRESYGESLALKLSREIM